MFPTKDPTYPEPLVDALRVELVRTGQDSEQLPRLEIAHAHNARGLVSLVRVRVKLVAEQRLDLQFTQPARFGLAEALGEVEQGLVVLGFGGIGAAEVRLAERRHRLVGEHRPAQIENDQVETDFGKS